MEVEGDSGREGKETATAAPYIITETDTNTEHQIGTRHEKCADPTAG